MNVRIEAKLAMVKMRLRDVGYTKFWVGANPHSSSLRSSSMIIAEPPCRGKDGRSCVALWEVLRSMYHMTCGNGLTNADQAQFLDLDLPEGEYDLKGF